MKSVVKRAIARSSENKAAGFRVENSVQHNSAIGTADCLPLIGQIRQGQTAETRLGDRITPKRLRVRGVLGISPDQQSNTKSLYVRVMILAQKNIKVGSAIGASVDTAHLLKSSVDGTAEIAYSGSTFNINDPINTDLFRVYMDKTVKLSPATNTTVQNEKGYARWSYTFKSLPASLTFDEGNGDWANNFAPFFAVGYAYADGTVPDTVATRLTSTTQSILTFEDA